MYTKRQEIIDNIKRNAKRNAKKVQIKAEYIWNKTCESWDNIDTNTQSNILNGVEDICIGISIYAIGEMIGIGSSYLNIEHKLINKIPNSIK